MIRWEEVARRVGSVYVGHAPLVGGVSSRVTALDVLLPDGAQRRVVVREPGAARGAATNAEATRREFRLLRHLNEAGFPVPPVLFVEDTGPVPYFVMGHVEGTTELPPNATPVLAELLARLHALPIEENLGLPTLEDPITNLPDLVGPDRESLCAHLAARPPLTPRHTLLHGDYWPGNVLWRDGRVAAVLDWEGAALGDPLSDVACCRLELRYLLGSTASTAFTAHYLRLAPFPRAELVVWDAYVAAAALRFMGDWGLPAAREANMRREARATLEEAEAELLRGG